MLAKGNAKFAVLGATGRTGRQLLMQSLAKGLDVTALARESVKLGDFKDAVMVVQGTIVDPATVERVVTGCSAVLSALGPARESPADLLTTSSLNIVAVMNRLGVKRLVVLTNTAVEDSGDRPPLAHKLLRAALRVVNGKLRRDSISAAKVITDSGLDWTLVRAPILTDGPRTGHYRAGPLTNGMPLRVSRADVADFMLSCVIEGKFVCERPVIGG